MFNDTIEFSGARMAPGSAHKHIVYSRNAPAPWWADRKDYEAVGIPLEKIESSAQAFDAMGRYTLEKVQCQITLPEGNLKRRVMVPDLYTIVRSDTREPFPGCGVSQKFALIQPEDGFATCDAIVKDKGAEYQIMGELAGGADLWATLALDVSIKVAGETINPYLLFYVKHDGSGAAKFKNVAERPECRNTLMIALRENVRQVAVSHIGNMPKRLEQATLVMRKALGYFSEFEEFANQLARTPFSNTDIGKLTDHLFPLPEDKGRARTNAETARAELLQCFMADNLNNLRGPNGQASAYMALNAVSDYNEHKRRIRNGTDDVDVRFERIFRRSFEDFSLVDKAQEFIMVQVRG